MILSTQILGLLFRTRFTGLPGRVLENSEPYRARDRPRVTRRHRLAKFCFDRVEPCTDRNHTVVKFVVAFREAARTSRVTGIVAVTAGREAVLGKFEAFRTAAVGCETGVARRDSLGWAAGLAAAG